MPTAILIAFEYTDTNNNLPGTCIDLYHSYKFCSTYCQDIYVVTDITEVNKLLLSDAIDNGIVKKDALNFYEKLDPYIITSFTLENVCKNPFSKKQPITNNFLSTIKEILDKGVPDEKLIIYWSGHGKDDSLVLPDDSLICMLKFRNHILNNISSTTDVFWILDCCNPNGLHLPFKLNNNAFSLATTDVNKISCVSQSVLLITSAENHQKSAATLFGSLFTRYLFQLLTIMNIKTEISINIKLQQNRNLRRLTGNLSSLIRKKYTGYPQNISIYSSYIIDPVLPTWIGSKHNFDVITNLKLDTLLVRQNKILL